MRFLHMKSFDWTGLFVALRRFLGEHVEILISLDSFVPVVV